MDMKIKWIIIFHSICYSLLRINLCKSNGRHDVTIQTYLIPLTPWHIRTHTNRQLDTAEGTFFAPVTEGAAYVSNDENSLFYPYEVGATGIIDILSNRKAE